MKYRYQLIQDGMVVAEVFAPTNKQAEKEINHYAFMCSQDGPVEIREVKKKKQTKGKR